MNVNKKRKIQEKYQTGDFEKENQSISVVQ